MCGLSSRTPFPTRGTRYRNDEGASPGGNGGVTTTAPVRGEGNSAAPPARCRKFRSLRDKKFDGVLRLFPRPAAFSSHPRLHPRVCPPRCQRPRTPLTHHHDSPGFTLV